MTHWCRSATALLAGLGAYQVTISGQPGDVVFPTSSRVAVILTPDQVVSVNFGGIRSPASALGGPG